MVHRGERRSSRCELDRLLMDMDADTDMEMPVVTYLSTLPNTPFTYHLNENEYGI